MSTQLLSPQEAALNWSTHGGLTLGRLEDLERGAAAQAAGDKTLNRQTWSVIQNIPMSSLE